MNNFSLQDVIQYIEDNIGEFHLKRIASLEKLKLADILKRKNPYLFRTKNLLTVEKLIEEILSAHLSSQEETLFGNFLEGLAIFICEKTYSAQKLPVGYGIDLLFEKENKVYLVEIKSGPHWGNSSQLLKIQQNFSELKTLLLQERTHLKAEDIIPVNGCCYGRCQSQKKGYLKLCGQEFWEFISGISELYVDIIEPLGHLAKRRNDEFIDTYAQIVNKLTLEFGSNYCNNGKIDWKKLIQSISAKTYPQLK
jgi:hypothetical protein